jgi:hypothetical protein
VGKQMAKKTKKAPIKAPLNEQVRFTEKERLEFMIQLMKNSISESENVLDIIMSKQIDQLKVRIAALKA